ncbi:MAG: amidohydrolase [SAR86 cluster bacterium]|uniref:Amidohydrolase n=1 Tax=SAR86 cluster bacterium TaxID=2030880 RepID=A0A2A5B4F7_9GAMM|nr:MAG: amidohydrolase [SAR86 cluster bacterium]
MTALTPGSDLWLHQVKEEILEPERPIIDPHHHLWKKRFNRDYLLPELWSDTNSGHNIVKTLFMECRAFYDRDSPEHLMSVGETKYIAQLARQSQKTKNQQAYIAGIVAHVDLCLAGESEELLLEALEQHRQCSDGLLKGIRHSAARDKHPEDLFIVSSAPAYLHGKESFRKGIRILADQGLTYDTWHYHHQNLDFLDLARAVPECTMVLDHFGTPLGVGVYKHCREEIFQEWKQEIREIAKCENVYAKLGGLAMPDNGFGWHNAECPPTSDELLHAQQKYYMHTIECFGPERCMFESNFPVDRLSINYHVLWNAFKKMAMDFNEEEKHALFYATAEKVYSLQD